MLMTTTNNVEGKRILHYYGIVSGETMIGANMLETCLQVFVISLADAPGLTRRFYARLKIVQ